MTTSFYSLPRSQMPTFPFALQSLEGQQGRQELADAQQTRKMPSRYLLRAGLLLVFVKHPLESPRNLKGKLWNMKP